MRTVRSQSLEGGGESQLSIEWKMMRSCSGAAGMFPNAVHGIVVVRGKNKRAILAERIRASNEGGRRNSLRACPTHPSRSNFSAATHCSRSPRFFSAAC